jgi:hypothetical protein
VFDSVDLVKLDLGMQQSPKENENIYWTLEEKIETFIWLVKGGQPELSCYHSVLQIIGT